MKPNIGITKPLWLLLLMVAANSNYAQSVESRKGIVAEVVFSFRFNHAVLDSLYRENASSLAGLNHILTHLSGANQLDSIVIVAAASPEGGWEYNRALSARRANTVKSYIARQYPNTDTNRISIRCMGENWTRLEQLIEADQKLPYRNQILHVIQQLIHPDTKEWRLKQIGKGAAWSYVARNYLHHLRTGAACILLYQKVEIPDMFNPVQEDLLKPATAAAGGAAVSPVPAIPIPSEAVQEGDLSPLKIRYIRPVAFKTNLLFDVLTGFNIELEVPIGKHFSLLGEWTFPWWGGLGNRGGVAPLPAYSEKYTVQMLLGGIEGRYWFSKGDTSPLTGWFLGIYAGSGLYDLQLKGEGLRGDFYISTGISGGYAHPLGKNWHMEYSVGVGYWQTSYEKYTPVEGQKVYQYSGQYRWFGPTKAKVSLVWMPQFKIKRR